MPTRIYNSSLITGIRKAQNDAEYYNRYQALLASGLPVATDIGGLIANPQTGNYDASTTTTLNFGLTAQYFKNYGDTTVLAPQQFLPIPRYTPSGPVYQDFIYSFNYTGTDVLQYIPVIRTGSLMISSSWSTDGSTNTVRISLLSFNDNGTTNDGISFVGLQGFYNDPQVSNLTIVQFGSIPLSRGGSQFQELTDITILPTSSPLMLSNTTLANCFYGCTTFNSDIGNWNTSSVIDISYMFSGAIAFNQQITYSGSGPVWNTAAVTNMNHMFNGATAFNNSQGYDPSTATKPLQWIITNVQQPIQYFLDNSLLNPVLPSNAVDIEGRLIVFTAANNDLVYSFDYSGTDDVLTYIPIYNTGNISILPTYSKVGNTYTVNVSLVSYTDSSDGISFLTPTPPGTATKSWYYNNTQNLTILQFGTIPLSREGAQFSLLGSPLQFSIQSVLPPNTLPGTSLGFCFNDCQTFNSDISGWNTVNVINMREMFRGASIFNQPIGAWDTCNVTNMSQLFMDAPGFNQPIGTWDTGAVTTMSQMFMGATSFNQDISGWDTHSLQDMGELFTLAIQFNQPIGSWDTSSVTNMEQAFNAATAFNQNISNWNTASVLNMSLLFSFATSFNNGDISGQSNVPLSWNTSSVQNMYRMFDNATAFNQDISGWNTSAVMNMKNMFYGASVFNRNISYSDANPTRWNTNAVTDMSGMFFNASIFNNGQPDGSGTAPLNWLTPGVSLPVSGFRDGSLLSDPNNLNYDGQPIGFALPPPFIYSFDYLGSAANILTNVPVITTGELDVSSAYTSVSGESTITYTVTVTKISFTDNGTTTDGISFANVYGFYNTTQGLTIQQFGSMPLSRGGSQFQSLSDITILSASVPTILAETSLLNCFNGCELFNSNIGNWDTSGVIRMSSMFNDARAFNQAIGSWNTSGVTDMDTMFGNAIAFNNGSVSNGSTALSNWNTGAVTTMGDMFTNATAFNQPIGSWNTSAVTIMTRVFSGASAFNQPIGSWDTSGVMSMDGMFQNAIAFNQPIGSWNTRLVSDMGNMFSGASAFNQPIGSWNTSIVTTMSNMFNGASAFNQNISYSDTIPTQWSTSAVRAMNRMFLNATIFNNGQPDGSGTAPLNWLTPGVTLPVPQFRDGSLLSDPNNLNYDGVPIGFAAPTASSFIYSVGYFGPSTNILPNIPVITTDNKLVVTSSYVITDPDQLIYTVTVSFVSFTDDGATNDGISFAPTNINAFFNQINSLSIQQFGDIPLSRGGSQFSSLTKIIIQPAAIPIILHATSFLNAFSNCTTFNSDISGWDTSGVTNMSYAFFESVMYNQPLGNWNTSNVTNMSYMFFGLNQFNQDISGWNTSNVIAMNDMFADCTLFNYPIGNWDTSKVQTMGSMFSGATNFNQPIGSWNTSAVRNMSGMFYNATNFNQQISYSAVDSKWNTYLVTNMDFMFYGATVFNNSQAPGDSTQPLGWFLSSLVSQNDFLSGSALNPTLPSNAVDNNGDLITDHVVFNPT